MFVWNDDVSDRVLRAQEDEEYLNGFIKENKRFILMKAFQTVKHFVSESDDEWSIALIAFHEAVRTYDGSKGNFRAFAALVIKRRLTDYVIAQSRHQAEIPVEADDMDGDGEQGEAVSPLQLEVRSRMAEISEQEAGDGTPGSTPMQDEIQAVQDLLRPYGFSFFDLTECSPKAEKTKKACAKAVAILLKDPALLEKMRTTHTLPMKELLEKSGIQKKLLERHRRYIIAAAEIMNGEYPLLREYMAYIRKALET